MEENFLTKAFEWILQHGKPQMLEINDISYSDRKLTRIRKPSPDDIPVTTLTAIVDYIIDNVDRILDRLGKDQTPEFFIHVVDFDRVKLYSFLDSVEMFRHLFMVAQYSGETVNLEDWHPMDKFIPKIQSLFLENETKADLLKVLGNLSSESKVTFMDDGVSMETQAKTGVARVDNVILPPVVNLIPFTTFSEVEQPERKYTLRLDNNLTRDGRIHGRLIPSDGESWKPGVMESIATFFKDKLSVDHPNITVIY